MILISERKIERTKYLIKNSKSRPIIIKGQTEDYNRKVLEYGRFDILFSPEENSGKSSIRQTSSGLNHVLTKIARKNKISIGIDLNEIKLLSRENKAERLTKIIQNIRLCRKFEVRLAVSGQEKISSFYFLLSLGASTKQAKEAEFMNFSFTR